jgi:molecular chaperone GrpE
VTDRDPRDEHVEPVVRDKRRIDPLTGALREPAATPAPQPTPGDRQTADETSGQGGDQVAAVEQQLAERTADLQRLQADFANYRKRVERDRLATQEMALANVLANLLPVLDDIGRAREHGELEGGFKSVAEALEAIVGKLGLATYGEAGDPFDPVIHEALTHSYSADVTEPSCVAIFQPGYRLGERVLRPARVAVAEPDPAGGGAPAAEENPEPPAAGE